MSCNGALEYCSCNILCLNKVEISEFCFASFYSSWVSALMAMHSDYRLLYQRCRDVSSYCTKDDQLNDFNLKNFPGRDILFFTHKYRPMGIRARKPETLIGQYLSNQLPILLKETEYNLQRINKIFAATWVTDRQVVFGTKCNKVFLCGLVWFIVFESRDQICHAAFIHSFFLVIYALSFLCVFLEVFPAKHRWKRTVFKWIHG